MVKLTPAQTRERSILLIMAGADKDFGYFNFETLSKRTAIEKRIVRLDCRRMARKGLTEYGKGLCTDEGELAGSGYAITPAGRAALQEAGRS
jgi:hypothetical protein